MRREDDQYWAAFREGREAERRDLRERFMRNLEPMERDEYADLSTADFSVLIGDLLKSLDLLDAYYGIQRAQDVEAGR